MKPQTMQAKFAYLALSLLVLIVDQVTKVWATRSLKPIVIHEVIPGYFRLSYATNRGVAFSMFADSSFDVRWILAGISTVAAVAVLGYLYQAPTGQRRLSTALALLLSGIIGNLIDRVRLGEVVDFIELHWRDVYSWPTFNVADSAICIGAVLLALDMLREEKPDDARPDTPAPMAAQTAEERQASSTE